MSKEFHSTYISYAETGKFTKIVSDYVNGAADLKPFYEHDVSVEGIKNAISQREKYPNNRKLLVEQLQLQYKNIAQFAPVNNNIELLLNEKTFTVCTAHQPNIFTGHLYFIYKILHTIQLADTLKKKLPEYNFVPVYFMGSEDADLEELNHLVVDGKKYVWHTNQKGAVGRMKVDDLLIKIIDEISGRVSVEKYGKDIIALLRLCFKKNSTIEEATFLLVHHLFKTFGLVVFLPDNGALKKVMETVFEEDIFKNIPSQIVSDTSAKLAFQYKVQAHPREINLFYLKDDVRNRLVAIDDHFMVHDTEIVFTKDELLTELKEHPGRFSPNVILRGLFQEMILPNLAFVGGGGELAYWLELKNLFIHYKVPFPMLIVRNSFLIIEKRFQHIIQKLELIPANIFKNEQELLNEIVKKNTTQQLQLDEEKFQIQHAYQSIKNRVKQIDVTLEQHAEALETQCLKRLTALEKKMLKAEKRKFSDSKNQLSKIYTSFFPGNGLQERTENFIYFYSKWGSELLDILYENSLTFEQQFCVLTEG